jgi:hypothetical protein
LNGGNGFTDSVIYTPATTGTITLTTSPSLEHTGSIDILILPYSTMIGFVGDSITASTQWQSAFLTALSGGYSIINR